MRNRNTNSLAVITARGGSKRIPRKNLRPFLGRPILAYSIEAALKSGCFREVMVSTDDSEIAEIAVRHGAVVPFLRSAKNSDDHAMTADVVLEVLERYAERGRNFDLACCLYPTAPFITPSKLQEGLELLQERSADCVMPVVRFGYPIQRALRLSTGRLEMMAPENISRRSQDLEPAFHDTGQFYWVRVARFLSLKTILMPGTYGIEVQETECQDIDNEVDWALAELKFSLMIRRGHFSKGPKPPSTHQ